MPHKWFCETCWETHWNWVCPKCGSEELHAIAETDDADCYSCGYAVAPGEFETLDGWS